ncbi:MAG TPA: tetratricopeptide repeat protein [Rhizomicrobium sp.]|nr:tetratricopeptide repeat protein [Rhizomicrobium sp.]
MSRILLWAFLLVVGLPLSAAWAAINPAPLSAQSLSTNKDVGNLLNEAQKALQAGKTDEALRSLNLAASLEPANPYLLARLGVVLNMAGDFQNAADRLRRARRLGAPNDVVLGPLLEAMLSMGQNQAVLDLYPEPDPKLSSFTAGIVLRARASALQVMGDSASASTLMKRSLEILRDYDGMMTAGRIALLQGDFNAADAHADDALKLRPKDVDAQILKIDLAMQRQQEILGQQMAEKLVADYPRSLAARLTRAKVYLSTDRADKAEADVNHILASQPDLPIGRYFRSIILARKGDVKGAWDVAHGLSKEYIQVDPGVTLNVAGMAVAAGFLESGASILNVAVTRFPYLLDARLQLADIRLRQKSVQYAMNALTFVADSKDPRVPVLLARAYLMKRDAANAQKNIVRAIELGGGEGLRDLGKAMALKSLKDYIAGHPDNKQVQKQYAVVALGFGETAQAKAYYERFVREDPADGFSFNNLAWLVVQDDSRRALSLAQQAVKADPNSPDYLDTLGTMQMTRSDFKGAVASLQKARRLRPADPGIAYHLALALEGSGALAQSQAILEELVQRGGFSDLEAAKNLLASKLKMAGRTQAGVR